MNTKKVTFKGKTIIFESDEKGHFRVVDGDKKVSLTEGPAGKGKLVKGHVDLTDLKITSIPEGAVIVTQTNPLICYWRYWNGIWYVYCC